MMPRRAGISSSGGRSVKGQSKIDHGAPGTAAASTYSYEPPAATVEDPDAPSDGSTDDINPGASAAAAADTLPPPPAHPGSTRVDTGWRPWKVVIGCFCLTVPTYGLLSGMGLFQTYWCQNILREYDEGDIAWIISVFGFLDCLFAAPAGLLFDRYGLRWLLSLGCAAYIASFIGLAFCSTYAGFMGCMAVAGIVASIPSTIAHSLVNQWFKARRGLATGCVTLGAPLGGIFFSLALQDLFDRFTWQTAALVLTSLMAFFLLLGNLLVETNLPSRTRSEDMEEPAEVSRMLTSPRFWLISYALFTYELVLFIQWGSIPSYAVAANVGNKQFYLVMSYNIGAVLGRTVPPWLSDRVLGPLNATIAMNAFTLLVVLAIWLPVGASSVAALFIVVALMGVGTGSFVPLGGKPENTGAWLGSAYSFVSLATLIGNPISAVILARYQPTGLLAFLGAVLFSGMISAGALRWLSTGRRWIVTARV